MLRSNGRTVEIFKSINRINQVENSTSIVITFSLRSLFKRILMSKINDLTYNTFNAQGRISDNTLASVMLNTNKCR